MCSVTPCAALCKPPPITTRHTYTPHVRFICCLGWLNTVPAHYHTFVPHHAYGLPFWLPPFRTPQPITHRTHTADAHYTASFYTLHLVSHAFCWFRLLPLLWVHARPRVLVTISPRFAVTRTCPAHTPSRAVRSWLTAHIPLSYALQPPSPHTLHTPSHFVYTCVSTLRHVATKKKTPIISSNLSFINARSYSHFGAPPLQAEGTDLFMFRAH